MADNISITPGSGKTVATDEVTDGTLGTVQVQFIKLMDGTLDSTNKLSISAGGAAKVDGSAVTQPISATSLPLPSGASTEATLTLIKAKTDNLDVLLSTRTKPTDTQNITGTVAVSNFPADQLVTVDRSGRIVVMKTNTLVTTAVTADQVILTYTVTAGKTFWLEYYAYDTRLTAVSATASILGTISLENPSGTKIFTSTETNPTTSETKMIVITFSEPIPITAGTVIRVVTTPAATTSMTWVANFGGYEI